MRLNQFDPVAPYYDTLARLAFGTAIRSAQLTFLDRIPPGSRVLVLGGGTGWWLPDLLTRVSSLSIYFVDASRKMISQARRRVSDDRVTFIHGTEKDVNGVSFDVVITPFILDLFGEGALRNFIAEVKVKLTGHGRWIVSDFVREKWWHALLLKTMYVFFRMTCGIQNRSLQPWKNVMLAAGLRPTAERHFFGKFICSCEYRMTSQA